MLTARQQETMLFLQNLPTEEWTEADIELILAQAFVWFSSFHHAASHFAGTDRSMIGGV